MASSMTRMIGAAHPAKPPEQPPEQLLSTEVAPPAEESELPVPAPETEAPAAETVKLPKRKPPPKKKDSLPSEINTVSGSPAGLASPAVSPEETAEPASSKKKEKREKKR